MASFVGRGNRSAFARPICSRAATSGARTGGQPGASQGRRRMVQERAPRVIAHRDLRGGRRIASIALYCFTNCPRADARRVQRGVHVEVEVVGVVDNLRRERRRHVDVFADECRGSGRERDLTRGQARVDDDVTDVVGLALVNVRGGQRRVRWKSCERHLKISLRVRDGVRAVALESKHDAGCSAATRLDASHRR